LIEAVVAPNRDDAEATLGKIAALTHPPLPVVGKRFTYSGPALTQIGSDRKGNTIVLTFAQASKLAVLTRTRVRSASSRRVCFEHG
jgi:hypothetical protein